MNTHLIFAALALGTICGGAAAADLEVTIGQCAAVSNRDARLACYDGLAAQLKPRAMAAAPVAPPAAPPVAPPSAPAVASVAPTRSANPADFGAEKITQDNAPADAPAPVEEIRAKVTTVALTPVGRFAVTLDNGQVWRQIDGDSSRARFKGDGSDVVTISRGYIGSYNLVVEGRSMLFKVRRVK